MTEEKTTRPRKTKLELSEPSDAKKVGTPPELPNLPTRGIPCCQVCGRPLPIDSKTCPHCGYTSKPRG